MNMLLKQSEDIVAETTSSLCFSITQRMVEKSPGFLEVQMLMCASSPVTLSTTLGEDQVWKD